MTRSNYITNSSIYFKVFSEEQCAEINSAVMEVLERVGAVVRHPGAIALLRKAGAYVDGETVRFPAALVERCMRSAPSRVVLCSREGQRTMFLEGNRTYFGTGPSTNFVLDPFTKERRHPVLEDTCRASRVIDALPNIDYQMDFGTARDVPIEYADVYMFDALLNNSTKPIIHWGFNARNYQTMVDMAAAAAGSLEELQKNPFVCFYSEPISPLLHDFEATDKAMFLAEKNLPCINTPCPLAGATAPATLAGTIVVSFAESLSSLVISQLVREGSPVIIGGTISNFDMNVTQMTYASPEFSLLAAGVANMAQYYKLPVMTTGGCSDSKCADTQAGVDVATSCLMAALSGANVVHDVGYMESGIASSLELLVIADEVIGQVKRIIKGIEVSEETLAVDVISRVGPGRHFIGDEHTFYNFKKEWWFPTLFNRNRYDQWKENGGLDLSAAAFKKLEKILNEYRPKPLALGTRKKIKEILFGQGINIYPEQPRD